MSVKAPARRSATSATRRQVGQAAGGAGEAVGQAAGGAGGAAGQVAGGAGDAAGQIAGAAGGGQGSGQDEQQQGQDGSGGDGDAGESTDRWGAPTAPKLAKAAAKTVAKEIGSAASDEAKELGMAATRKVRELGERRRHKRAERHNATEAAMRLADELESISTRSTAVAPRDGSSSATSVRPQDEEWRWPSATASRARSDRPTSRSGRRFALTRWIRAANRRPTSSSSAGRSRKRTREARTGRLSDEVEPGKTYRDVPVGWRAAAWVENARDEGSDRDEGEGEK